MGLWVTKSPCPTNEREDTQGASWRHEGACTQLAWSRLAAGSEMSEGVFPECLWSLAKLSRWTGWSLPCWHPAPHHSACPLVKVMAPVPQPCRLLRAVWVPWLHGALLRKHLAWSCDSMRLVHFEPGLVSAVQTAGIRAEVCVGPMAKHLPD